MVWRHLSRQSVRRILIALGLIGLILGIISPALPGPNSPANRLALRGHQLFLAGVNYPYRSEEDFGTGAWGYSGVNDPTTYQEVDTDFANLEASGVRVVKWRVFNDGRYSPTFDQDGMPTGLGDHFFSDIDAATALARKHHLYLVFTLFSSGFWTTDCVQNDVHLGGHADIFSDPIKRQALIERAIIPLVRHLANNDRVLSYEIIAEPDWGVSQLNQQSDNRIKVGLSGVRAFVKQVAAAIHYYTPALATVEANRASDMTYWKGLGLDYYSFSWYDWLEPYDPLDRPAASLGLDRPIVLGEFPSVGSKYYHTAQVYDIALRQGYAGAFAWSYGNADQYSNWANVANEYLRWSRENWSLIDVAPIVAPPSGTVQLLAQPFQYQGVQVLNGQDGFSVQAQVAVQRAGTYGVQWFIYDSTQNPGPPAGQTNAALSNAFSSLTTQLGSLATGRTYKVSMGLFDQSGHLVKWFDSVAVLKMVGGVPQIQTQVVEDPCGRQTLPGNA